MNCVPDHRDYYRIYDEYVATLRRAEEAEALLKSLRDAVLHERKARRDYGDHLTRGTSPDTKVFADAWSAAQQAFDEVSWACSTSIDHLRKFGQVL